MAIVDMSKFHLMSFGYDRELLLRDLQRFDYVHFDDLQVEDDEAYAALNEVEVPESITEINEELAKANWAIDILSPYKVKLGMITEMKLGQKSLTLDQLNNRAQEFDFDHSFEELKELSDQKTALLQEKTNLESQLDELSPWTKLSLPVNDLYGFNSVKAMTGSIADKYVANLEKDLIDLKETYLEKVDSVDGNSYVLLITTNEEYDELAEILRKNAFTQIRINAKNSVKDEISDNAMRQEKIDSELKVLEDKIESRAYLLENFEIYHDYLDNKKTQIAASENFLSTSKVDIIEGYVPTKKEEEFKNLLTKVLGEDYYLEINPADRDDANVPIILENNAFAEAYENTTAMYSLPKYNEIDPTPLLAPFYAFFSGMMVGDLGYGLLLFIITFIGLKAFNLKKSQRNFFKFLMYMGFFAIVWGLIYGSFFGGVIEMPKLINQETDSMTLIIISLIFGAVHIFFALGIQAYMDFRDGKPLDALFDVGFWYMILIGLVLMIAAGPLGLPAIVGEISKWAAIIGAIGIVVTGGREAPSMGGKIAGGIYSLYGVTSYIGDFVSYLRLMALGLSGGFIAVAVNLIVKMLFGAGIAGIAGGIVLFVAMQAFNMFLSYLSAYVHTARLTYVEMFNKFYEGGGKPFRKMIKESKFFNIINENE